METYKLLQRREAEGNPIRVGLVGCGQMGSGLVHVTNRQMAGMTTMAIADIDVERPLGVFASLGVDRDDVCVTTNRGEAEDALRHGRFVVTEDAVLLAHLDGLDAVVEATGVTEIGAQIAWNSIMNKKHVVMLNVETDVTVGVLLNRLARQMGCVYTAAQGDEPGVCNGLYDFATTLGFEVVCLGKGKNNPLNVSATPDSCREEAEHRGMNPKMLASFQDGTKTMVEMAAVSNATGLVPDVKGMHGPKVDLDDLTKVFIPEADGGILSRSGCVDYSTGRVAPGVFAIVTTPEKRVRTDLQFVGMGEGPYYRLYRPYHLCNIETPLAIADAVFYGAVTVAADRMVSEVVAVAKRDLKAGETVGDIGGPDFYNTILKAGEAAAQGAIPMGLATHGRVLKDVSQGTILTADSFQPDDTRFAYKLRRMQDDMLRDAR